MKRLVSSVAVSGLILTAAAAVAPGASADERVCRGYIGKVVVDDILVPRGATCSMYGTRVKGNIKVDSGALLKANKLSVDGNIQTQGHRSIAISGVRIDGNIQVEAGGGASIRTNDVDGDIQVFSNRSGSKNIYDNRVAGNLQCKSNYPAPKGARNKVQGNKEGQCRRF
ncbi:hypothetical protein [Janibacter terrae]|uniref:hypothetical protein n=1 Tax=Janibacter terrae TaxID=103817 RepID=UPI0031F996CE